jgi:hypothetical protein
MKEIKILIRLDEENERMGFALERNQKDKESLSEVLKVIAILDILKQREMEKLNKMNSKEFVGKINKYEEI